MEPLDVACDSSNHQSMRVRRHDSPPHHSLEGQTTENSHREEAAASWDSYNYMDDGSDILFDTDSLDVPDWIEPSTPYLEEYVIPLSN